MKKLVKSVSGIVLTTALLLSLSFSSVAADSSVTFNGHGKGFDFKPGSEYTATDLFDNFKNAMPGDTLSETITITNNSSDSDYVKLYIRALPHDESANPLSEKVAETETVASMKDFLSQLNMKVFHGEKLIFNASPDKLEGMAENVLLGSFEKGKGTTLTVELSVPLELSDEYANRVGEVDWVFLTEGFDHPTPPAEEKPTDSLIQTGALNLPVPILAIVGAGLIALGAIIVTKKEKQEDA